jgi:hypothetical protein
VSRTHHPVSTQVGRKSTCRPPQDNHNTIFVVNLSTNPGTDLRTLGGSLAKRAHASMEYISRNCCTFIQVFIYFLFHANYEEELGSAIRQVSPFNIYTNCLAVVLQRTHACTRKQARILRVELEVAVRIPDVFRVVDLYEARIHVS